MTDSQLNYREKIGGYFEEVNTPIGFGINLAILALSILSLAIFVIQTYSISPQFREILNYLDQFVLILFAIEYGLRFWSAKSRLKFVVDFFSLIDLISIIPLFLWGINVRFFRIFRWFRLLKLIRLSNSDLFAVKFKVKDHDHRTGNYRVEI